jgi:hypothetical protein
MTPSRLAPVYCDDCGWPIASLEDGRVRLITGRDSFDVVSVLLVHRATARPKCTNFERQLGGQIQDYTAAELLDEQIVAAVKDMQSSRREWPNVRRLLMRVARLGRLDRRAKKRAFVSARREKPHNDGSEHHRVTPPSASETRAAQSHGRPTTAVRSTRQQRNDQ